MFVYLHFLQKIEILKKIKQRKDRHLALKFKKNPGISTRAI